jgi:hypothetical protein
VTPEAWREQIGAYVLGSLDEAERTAFEAMLADGASAEDKAELARSQAAVALLERGLPHPRAELWREIEAALPLSPVALAKVRRRKREMIAWSLAIAASLVGLWLWNHDRLLDEAIDRAEQATNAAQKATEDAQIERDAAEHEHAASLAAIRACQASLSLVDSDQRKAVVTALEAKETQLIDFAPAGSRGAGGRSARLIYAPDQPGAWVVGSGFLPEPGKTYQLWTIRGTGSPAPAGVAKVAADGRLLAPLDAASVAGGPPDAVAVSLEADATDATPELVLLIARRS